MTRTALGCSGFGWLPALAASIAPADMCSSSASAICERALFPVHRNKTRRRRRRAPSDAARVGRRGHEPQAGMERAAGRLQLLPTASEIDRVVAVAADRPSCDAPTRARRRGADAGGTTPGSAARRPAAVSSRTARSLRTSSCSSRHRTGCDDQPHEPRRTTGSGSCRDARLHEPERIRLGPIRSTEFYVSALRLSHADEFSGVPQSELRLNRERRSS